MAHASSHISVRSAGLVVDEQGRTTAPLHVAIIVHSLNHNNIGRVYPFLRAFVGSPDVRLRLIGWDESGSLFPLLNQLPWPITRLRGAMTGAAAHRALSNAVNGCDLVHCFKNRAHAITALAVAQAHALPLIMDLDDWELGLYLEGITRWPRWRQVLWGGPITRRISEALYLEQLARAAPAGLLVNSSALQAHFGGAIAYTAADPVAFDPQRADGVAFRRAHAIPDQVPVIGFLGTPHPHKGIDDLLAAFATIQRVRPEARLLFVGVPSRNPYHARLRHSPGVTAIGYIEDHAYPAAYAASDIIVIPQRPVTEGIMQTPAKLILSMAMGRPIVATNVGDIPLVLGDTGIYVPPEDPATLATTLVDLLDAPEERAQRGASARAHFLAHFTLEHLRNQVLTLYTQACQKQTRDT